MKTFKLYYKSSNVPTVFSVIYNSSVNWFRLGSSWLPEEGLEQLTAQYQHKSPRLLHLSLHTRDVDAANCRYQKAGSFPHVLPATTREHYLAGQHHQRGNPGDNRTDAIATYPVQVDSIIVRSVRSRHPPQPRCSYTPIPTDRDGPLNWSEVWRQMAMDPWSTQNNWCCQIWTDVKMSPRNYWDVCIHHGLNGVTQRSTKASQWRWCE